MKTAVSLPDNLFKSAETTARELKISRSELYAQALSEFIQRRNREALAAELEEVYATESSELDPVLKYMQFSSIKPEKW